MNAKLEAQAPEEVLFSRRSAFQRIELAQEASGHINLTLDRHWQFRSQDEYIFHETLVDTPIVLAPKIDRVLVLGGGDGLAVRNALRYPEVRELTLCELDPCVIEMTQTIGPLVELTENSLNDPRVRIVTDDAQSFIRHENATYDVVICDFPTGTTARLAELFAPDFFRALTQVTHDDTLIGVQVSREPEAFWPICAAVENSFPWVLPLLINMGEAEDAEDDWADFVIASQSPRTPVRELAEAVNFLSLDRLGDLKIRNRSGQHFQSDAYGIQRL